MLYPYSKAINALYHNGAFSALRRSRLASQDAASPSSLQHPASGLQAVFFAKPASMPVYFSELFSSSKPQKSFEAYNTHLLL